MADTNRKPKKTNPKSAASNKKIKESAKTQKSAKRTTKSAAPKTQKVKEDTSFISEAAGNIEAGAKVVGEKASDVATKIADKSSKLAGDIFEKIKKGVSDAYDVSAKAVDELGKTAQGYLDKYESTMEMRKLSDRRKKVATKLGERVYTQYKLKKKTPTQLLQTDEVKASIAEITKLDKEIVKLGKIIDKKK